jgi:hypothetical protein
MSAAKEIISTKYMKPWTMDDRLIIFRDTMIQPDMDYPCTLDGGNDHNGYNEF